MKVGLSAEIFWLTLTLLMTAFYWAPYIIIRMLEQGILSAIWDPQGITDTNKAWARRMMQAHANAVENLAIFAPLVILIEITGLNTTVTATACMVYFFTRLAHFIVFTFAIPVLRVVTFLIGFGVQITLAMRLLGLI